MISVVVPVRGEAPPSARFLAPLRAEPLVELLVAADASAPAATLAAWRSSGASVVLSAEPRGSRLNAAASASLGETLLFLHADTILPNGFGVLVRRAIRGGAAGGAFRLAFDGGGPALRFVATVAALRTALTRVPYGDQAPFVRRDLFARLGGFPPWPLLEEVDLGRRLRKLGPIALLPARALTSPRRYLERGVTRTFLENWSILLRWRLGASPFDLAKEYRTK